MQIGGVPWAEPRLPFPGSDSLLNPFRHIQIARVIQVNSGTVGGYLLVMWSNNPTIYRAEERLLVRLHLVMVEIRKASHANAVDQQFADARR